MARPASLDRGTVGVLLGILVFSDTAAAQTLRNDPEEFIAVPPVGGPPASLLLETPVLAFVPKGTMRVTASAGVTERMTVPYSGLRGDLTEWGRLRVDIGFGSRIQMRVEGVLQQVLRIDRDRSQPLPPVDTGGLSARDVGDFSVVTIARVMPETDRRPAVGLRVEAKLPNTNQRNGLGTNTTDVLLSAPLQKHFGQVLVAADLGVGILTEPTDAQRQNDVLLYGLAAAWQPTPRTLFSAEVVGRWAVAGETLGTSDRAVARFGGSRSFGSFAVGVILTRGLTETAGRFGASIVVSYGFRVFRNVRPD